MDRSVIASVAFILLGAYALWGTRDMSELGSVFPQTIGIAMIVLSTIDVVRRWMRREPAEAPQPGSTPRRALLVVILLAWALLLRPVGFLTTSAVASLLLLSVAHQEAWTRARAIGYVLGTLAVVIGLYSVFAFGLDVPLPRGFLF